MLGRLPWLAFERRRRALRFFVFFDMVRQVIGDGQRRHLLRASVSDGLHVYDTPLSDTPVAPNGEQ